VIRPSDHREHLIDDINQWPIARLYRDREGLVESVIDDSLSALGDDITTIESQVATTIFLEIKRLKENPWKVDLKSEPKFWKKMKADYNVAKDKSMNEVQRRVILEEIRRTIVHRYSEEIAGGFNERSVRFARKFLRLFFAALLNASKLFKSKKNRNTELSDKIKMYGDTSKIAELFNQGVVVVLPTHFSNLDSLLIAYSMDMIAGLPSFSYGAGLNLFESEILAYFMNRLGTYRIDRRKKNPLYLETLMSFSRVSIKKGTNSLFFPGGTRSRSGKMETQLKLGLLNTLIESQRELIASGSKQKLFVVPLIIGYNVVLEARSLIDQHLRRLYGEKFLAQKESTLTARQILRFGLNYFRQDSEIVMSFGQPMDILGNPVSSDGRSLDEWNREINIADYFIGPDGMEPDLQREAVYTRRLAAKVVTSYHEHNVVLSSHVIAHVAFMMYRRAFHHIPLVDLLNQRSWEYEIDYVEFKMWVKRFKKELVQMETRGELLLDPALSKKFKRVLATGIKLLGSIHNTEALTWSKKNKSLTVSDHRLLHYYSNRIATYEFKTFNNEDFLA